MQHIRNVQINPSGTIKATIATEKVVDLWWGQGAHVSTFPRGQIEKHGITCGDYRTIIVEEMRSAKSSPVHTYRPSICLINSNLVLPSLTIKVHIPYSAEAQKAVTNSTFFASVPFLSCSLLGLLIIQFYLQILYVQAFQQDGGPFSSRDSLPNGACTRKQSLWYHCFSRDMFRSCLYRGSPKVRISTNWEECDSSGQLVHRGCSGQSCLSACSSERDDTSHQNKLTVGVIVFHCCRNGG